VPGCQKLQLTA